MDFYHLKRKSLLSLLCFLCMAIIPGCRCNSNRFGVIFVSDNGVPNTFDIYKISNDPKHEIIQLTFSPTDRKFDLLVSAYGDKVVYDAIHTSAIAESSNYAIKESRHIYTLNTADKQLVDMTDLFSSPPFGLFTIPMDWSSDQKQFAVKTNEGEPGIMDFNGENRKILSIPLNGHVSNVKDIKWSPDGKKILIIRGYAPVTPKIPGWELLMYDLESGKVTQLADFQTDCYQVKWSPTSQQVAATCDNIVPYTGIPGPDTIRIFNTENPGQAYEHIAMVTCRDPSWSPDGGKITFACEKGSDEMGLFIINSDGNGLHEVKLENLGNPSNLRYPNWSPDGNQIIYVASIDDLTNIYCVNSDGTNNQMLTHQSADYQELSVYPIPGG